MDRLTMRTTEGMAAQNCYDCKMQHDAVCDYLKLYHHKKNRK